MASDEEWVPSGNDEEEDDSEMMIVDDEKKDVKEDEEIIEADGVVANCLAGDLTDCPG